MPLTQLDRLEAEAIHVLREVVAKAARPVMLYSADKDSAAMLHLARKASHPAVPPFPLLHVDTGWKLKQALDTHGFDAAIWGIRRDGGSRAAPRNGSFRSAPPDTAGTRRLSDPNCGHSTICAPRGRERAGLPAIQLDRARRVALRPA